MPQYERKMLLLLAWAAAVSLGRLCLAQPGTPACTALLDELLRQYNVSSAAEAAVRRVELEGQIFELFTRPECKGSPEKQDTTSWKTLAPAFAVPSGILVLVLVGIALAWLINSRRIKAPHSSTKPSEAANEEAGESKPAGRAPAQKDHGILWRCLQVLLGRKDIKIRRHGIEAPGVGPYTTLLLSDVQNSTSLWEMLPTYVMDECMRLHDECFRMHLKKHQGYESATEGDAFLLSFWSPADALRYAVDVQTSLLQVPWPSQLSINPDGRPVHCLVDADTTANLPQAPLRPKQSSRLQSVVVVNQESAGPSEHGVTWGVVQSAQSKLLTPMLSSRSFRRLKVSDLPWLSRPSTQQADEDQEEEVEQIVQGAEQVGAQSCLPALGTNTWSKQLGFAFPRVRESAAHKHCAHLIFKGLRVRMGIHTGIENKADVVTEPTSGRTTYCGPAMDMARAVADAAPGGGVLLSQDAFVHLPHSLLASATAMDRAINSASGPSQGSSAGAIRASMDRGPSVPASKLEDGDDASKQPINAFVVYAGDHTMAKLKSTVSAVSMYMAVPSCIPGRLAWLAPIRNTASHALGTSAAPVGMVTIAFLHVVGAAALLTDLPGEARHAINRVHSICIDQLTKHKGFAVEVVDGLMLVAFQHPVQAVCWAIKCNEKLQEEAWSASLLQHEACKCGPDELAPWAHPLSVLPPEMAANDVAPSVLMNPLDPPSGPSRQSISIEIPVVRPRAVKSFSISRRPPSPPEAPNPPPLAPPAQLPHSEINGLRAQISTSDLSVTARSTSHSKKLIDEVFSLRTQSGLSAWKQSAGDAGSPSTSTLLGKVAGFVRPNSSGMMLSTFNEHSNALFAEMDDRPSPEVFAIDKPRAPKAARKAPVRKMSADLRPENQPSHQHRRPSLVQYLSSAVNRSSTVLSSMLPGASSTSSSNLQRHNTQAEQDAANEAALQAEAAFHEETSAARAAGQRLPGLFVKIGIDLGKVLTSLQTQTGRIHYRGKVMNRAARVAARCQPSQILLTGLAWKYATAAHDLMMIKTGVCGDELGGAEMKGVPGLVELVHCFGNHAEANIRAEEQKAKETAEAELGAGLSVGLPDLPPALSIPESYASAASLRSAPGATGLPSDTATAVCSPNISTPGTPISGFPGPYLVDNRSILAASLRAALDSSTAQPVGSNYDLDSPSIYTCASSFNRLRTQGTDLTSQTLYRAASSSSLTQQAVWGASMPGSTAVGSLHSPLSRAGQPSLEESLDVRGISKHGPVNASEQSRMFAALQAGSRSAGHLRTEGLYESIAQPSGLKPTLSQHPSLPRRASRLGLPMPSMHLDPHAQDGLLSSTMHEDLPLLFQIPMDVFADANSSVASSPSPGPNNSYSDSNALYASRPAQPVRQMSHLSSMADDPHLRMFRPGAAVGWSVSSTGGGEIIEVTKRGVVHRDAAGNLRFSVKPRITEDGLVGSPATLQ